jgi:K+/H+ antiporter YhaU regulatory subunit KhtT
MVPDRFSIEVTLRQDYLERHGMKSPAVWEEQPDIQKKIEATLRKEWAKIFTTGKEARAMLAERVKVPQAELFDFMADTRNTLAKVLERQDAQARDIAELKRDMEQGKRDMEQLKRATGLK